MYFIKELRQSSQIIIHAGNIRKNEINLHENYHSSSDYIFKGIGTTSYRTLVNEGRNRFFISEMQFIFGYQQMNFLNRKFIFGYQKIIFGYQKFIFGYGKFIFWYRKFIYGY